MDAAVGCICCSGSRSEPYLPGLLQCPECSHVWADMRLSDDDLRALYGKDYFHGAEYADYELERDALKANFKTRIEQLLTAGAVSGRKLLEIGCAYGFFLADASKVFDAEGVDISEHAVTIARDKQGQNAKALDYTAVPTNAGAYNVVCLWDTVEHLAHPETYLEKAFDELEPGGVLALSTGDIGSRVARLRGAKWRLIHPPTHLHYFTRTSIITLLQRLGYQDISVTYPPFYRSVRSVLCHFAARADSGICGTMLKKAGNSIIGDIKFPLNTFDLMTVTAKKNP